jgi:hypothetical protein
MAALKMARIRPLGISCGIKSTCLSYVTVSAVSISKRCTVYILKKISASCYLGAGVVELWSMGPGLGRGAADRLSQHFGHVILCQAPVPDNF